MVTSFGVRNPVWISNKIEITSSSIMISDLGDLPQKPSSVIFPHLS